MHSIASVHCYAGCVVAVTVHGAMLIVFSYVILHVFRFGAWCVWLQQHTHTPSPCWSRTQICRFGKLNWYLWFVLFSHCAYSLSLALLTLFIYIFTCFIIFVSSHFPCSFGWSGLKSNHSVSSLNYGAHEHIHQAIAFIFSTVFFVFVGFWSLSCSTDAK